MYVIVGATGNTGRVVAERLLANGKKVRVIGRQADRLQPLVKKGAEAFVSSVNDSSEMLRAFQGAQGAYLMIPPDLRVEHFRVYQNEVGQVYAGAIRQAGVPFVVNLSSLGAYLPEGAGPISGLGDVEKQLSQVQTANIVHLRAAYFMENFYLNLDLISNQGLNGTPLRGDLPIPMIAARDIGEAAAELLLGLDFSGHSTRELLGQRDISMQEATRIIGGAIGKPDLAYVQFPYERAEKAMVGMGLSQDVARGMSEMYRAINEGRVRSQETRSELNSTSTSFEQFADGFARVYRDRAGAKAKGA
ncbi:MAG: NmrA family NAD(P)-binding protein [Acidobacteriota bacterium]